MVLNLIILKLWQKKLGNLDNLSFSFTGYLEHKEVLNYLFSHDIHCFITTSETEGGVPMSIMEAIQFIIPIIGPNIGGISEIVDDTDGILIPDTAKAKDFAIAIEKIATMSPEQYEGLRKGAFSMGNKKFNGNTNYTAFAEELYTLK